MNALLEELREDIYLERLAKGTGVKPLPFTPKWKITGYVARVSYSLCTRCKTQTPLFTGFFRQEETPTGERKLIAIPLDLVPGTNDVPRLAEVLPPFHSDACIQCLPQLGFSFPRHV
jgi:hypothetical protein